MPDSAERIEHRPEPGFGLAMGWIRAMEWGFALNPVFGLLRGA